ncbi:zinc ribbon domain-containing protein [Nocardia concava]|uniref:zinc ribbon domain-containing protein n=1 Tax=Nocardia concava TaxID=257281 RepID=UPI000594DC59|nr:zinc ribbon domain-containing protein [Nocardia concava]
MMRAYRLPTTANREKLDAVAAILPCWQRGLVHVQYIQVRKLKAGVTQLGWLSPEEAKALPPYLSQRHWRSVVNQVNGALASWRGKAKTGLREVIRSLHLQDEVVREELYRINTYQAWWAVDNVLDIKRGLVVSDQAIRESARIADEWLRKNPFPNLSEVRTMAMDGPIAGVSVSNNSGADYWVKVSTLDKGRPVSVPLQGYDYFNKAAGRVRNFCQVTVSPAGQVTFALVKESVSVRPRRTGETVGLDWGLKNIFTSSSGELLGRRLYGWLCLRDRELSDLVATLQRQKIRPRDSKRFVRLNRRIREYVRNEVGRVLNRLADRDIRELVVEELDFRIGGLSTRLNRILRRAGRAVVRAKLDSLVETHGIIVTEVNSAYTSRRCSGCGYVDKRNRTSQERFACRFCGRKLLADTNAARNILGRSEDENGLRGLGKERVLAEMDRMFRASWRFDPTLLRERPTRGRSTATSETTSTGAESIPTLRILPARHGYSVGLMTTAVP